MADYETEEQQVEALKNWWKQNGLAVIGGAVLGISALIGWRGWNWHQEKLATEASDIFVIVQDATIKNDSGSLQEQTKNLRDNYASTPYASLATLYEAKSLVEKGDAAAAEESLRWVLKNSNQDSVRSVARLRLARVLLADNKVDDALAMIDGGIPEAYQSLADEIRGDIYVAKGELDLAKEAYDQALLSSNGSGAEYLQLKRNDLGS